MIDRKKGAEDTTYKKTRGELVEEIIQLKAELPIDELRPPQIFLTDATPEATQNALAEHRGRISLMTDEGNFLDILSGMYSGGKQNLDVFLQGHAGGPLRVKRSNRVVDLPDIAISIGLAVQPAVLSEQAASDRRKFRGKGLLARFLFVLPRSNIGRRDVTKREPIQKKVRSAYFEGIKALLNIQPAYDESNVEIPRMLELDPDALRYWEGFAQWVENDQGEGGRFERLQDFTGKLPGAALRIAGICHVAEQLDNTRASSPLSALSPVLSQKSTPIDESTLCPIIELCKSLIIHAQAALELMGDDPVISDAKYALKWIKASAERNAQGAFVIGQNDLHRASRFKNSKLERVIKALDILRERNIISPQYKLATQKPTYVYYVNPKIILDGA